MKVQVSTARRCRQRCSCIRSLSVVVYVVTVLVGPLSAVRGPAAMAQSPLELPRFSEADAAVAVPHGGDMIPVTSLETRLMKSLACVCGDCDLLPIIDCTCDFARDMRAEVKDSIRRMGAENLAPGEGKKLASEIERRVRDEFVSKYGAAVLIKATQDADEPSSWLAIVVVVGIVVPMVLLVIASRRARRDD